MDNKRNDINKTRVSSASRAKTGTRTASSTKGSKKSRKKIY